MDRHPQRTTIEVPQRHLDGGPGKRVALETAGHLVAERLDLGSVSAD
jgi:hypothetical protein